jgi:ABC-type Zn uptake system ZnuABC Zn-binding protein ZnuA
VLTQIDYYAEGCFGDWMSRIRHARLAGRNTKEPRPLPNVITVRVGRLLTLLVLAVALSACSSGGDGGGDNNRLRVAVSDPPLTDLTRRVAGDALEVVGLVPLGADGHTYEPRPEDARKLAGASLYIENGFGLNNTVTAFARDALPADTPMIELASTVPPRDIIPVESPEQIAAHGHAHVFNVHFWPDPVYAAGYVREIERALIELDPPGADGYRQRAAALVGEIDSLRAAIETAVGTIPPANRKLVVYHDAWSYFGRRFGIPVVGSVQPANFSEPSAAEVRAIITQVRQAGVPAFFGSEVFPSDVLKTIAEETGARYFADLSDDKLPGRPRAPEHGYVGMMVENARTIVNALGGNAGALDPVDPKKR